MQPVFDSAELTRASAGWRVGSPNGPWRSPA